LISADVAVGSVASVLGSTLRFEVVGASQKLFLGNTLLAFAHDSAITAAGGVGVRTLGSASLDGFRAEPAPGPTDGSLGTTYSFAAPQRPDGQLDSVWTEQVGNFAVTGNKVAVGNGPDNLATLNGVSATDVVVQAQVAGLSAPGQLIGLVARSSPTGMSDQYQGILYNAGGTAHAVIYRNLGGTWSMISADVAVGPAASVAGATLRFEVVGGSLKLFLSNTLIAFAQDSTISGAGGVGMRTLGAAALNSFRAAAPTLPPANGSLGTTYGFESPQRPDSQLDNVWTEHVGNFAVTGTTSKAATGSGADNLATLNGVAAADVAIQAQIKSLDAGQLIGLSARYSGPGLSDQYMGLIYNAGGTARAAIYRNLGGTWALLGADVALGTAASVLGSTLRFEVLGTSLKLFVGSNLVSSVTDSAISGAGGVGMRTVGAASLDDFRAATLP
jgi:hypothetical protein